MKQFTLWLDPDAIERVRDAVGRSQVSAFVREAVKRELKRRERTAREAKAKNEA